MSRPLGFFFVLLSGIGFGFLGIFSRIAFRNGMGVGELLTWRFFCASILLGVGLSLFKPSLLNPGRRQILISLALGMAGYAVFSTLYFKSIEGISVPLAAMLLYTFPIFTNLFAHFLFKERMSRPQVLSLVLAVFGLVFLLWGPLVVNSKAAIFFGLGSGFTYAIYVLISGRVQREIHPLSSSLYVIMGAGLALFAFHRPSFEHLSQLNLIQLTCVVGLAVVSTIGPLTFFLAGLQRLPTGQASIIAMIEPVVAAIAGGFLLGESLSGSQWIGAALVLLALILSALEKQKKPGV